MRRYDPAEELPRTRDERGLHRHHARRDAGAFARRLAIVAFVLAGVCFYYLYLRYDRGDFAAELRGTAAGALFSSADPRGDKASRWEHLDWMAPKKRSTLHRNFLFHPETNQWQRKERRVSCGNPEADEAIALGADQMYRHLSNAYIHPVRDLKMPLSNFRRAMEIAPECATARINWCIVQTAAVESPVLDLQQCAKLMSAVPETSSLRSKALLWQGLTTEQLGNSQSAHELYHSAFARDPSLARWYFGKPANHWKETQRPCAFFRDQRLKHPDAIKLQQRTLRRLLMYAEFAQFFGGYSHYTKDDADAFIDLWYTHVRHMIPPYVVRVLQECYRGFVRMGALKFNDIQSKRWYHYNDPVVRFLSSTYNDFVTRVSDMPTKITYTYMGAYPGGSQLPPHVDRAQCEWTLSVAIDVNPGDQVCALGIKKEPKKLSKERSHGKNTKPDDPSKMLYVYPHQGDGILFRGRGLVHWRDPIPDHMNCTNLFLHYVLEDHVGKQD
eukprot:TRINITY_DN1401_c0_g1_i1.p1 TRINITY_DN1401_c0_g1~~TRINITY_DN1401_c0_g1_i1.p1  ORF type:complete len:499 (+),score=124.74 TRINITY_DN1401_c0_g1_i1:60-1556(+)